MLRFMFCKDAGRKPQLFRHITLYIHYIYWFNIATVIARRLNLRLHSAQTYCKFFLKVKCLHFSKTLMVYSEHSLELAAAEKNWLWLLRGWPVDAKSLSSAGDGCCLFSCRKRKAEHAFSDIRQTHPWSQALSLGKTHILFKCKLLSFIS